MIKAGVLLLYNVQQPRPALDASREEGLRGKDRLRM